MAFLQSTLAKAQGIKTTKTRVVTLPQQDSKVVAAAQDFDFELPKNRFIWSILVSIGEDTTATATQGTLADDLVAVKLIGNGNKYIKDMTAEMSKALNVVNFEAQGTGYYKFYLKDPKLDGTLPLPAWFFTSLALRLTDNAPAASNYHHIRVGIVESELEGMIDFSHYPILVEKYLRWAKYGANTLWQEYTHERAYKVFGYLYCQDDNASLSDTKFDKLTLKGVKPDGEVRPLEEFPFAYIKQMNQQEYMAALATGFHMVEFPDGWDTSQYTSLTSLLNIPTGGTNIGMRVLERYILA